MKPASVIALIKKQSGRPGPAESNDYLWDVVTESAWFFSDCLNFLAVLLFKFWSFCNCIRLYRKEKAASKWAFSKYSSWPSQVASYTQLHHLTFDTRVAVGNACALQIWSSLLSQQLRSQIDIFLQAHLLEFDINSYIAQKPFHNIHNI